MYKILLITHGTLAEAFKETARMFFADEVDKRIVTLGLKSDDGIEQFRVKTENLITENYSDKGLMIFVDIFAGTPFNTVAMIMNEFKEKYPKTECFSGINLGLLMEALSSTEELNEFVIHLENIIPESIVNVKKYWKMNSTYSKQSRE